MPKSQPLLADSCSSKPIASVVNVGDCVDNIVTSGSRYPRIHHLALAMYIPGLFSSGFFVITNRDGSVLSLCHLTRKCILWSYDLNCIILQELCPSLTSFQPTLPQSVWFCSSVTSFTSISSVLHFSSNILSNSKTVYPEHLVPVLSRLVSLHRVVIVYASG